MNRFKLTIALSMLAIAVGSSLAATANAGNMWVFMQIDPAVTAGAGVASFNGMTVTSTRSGTGTWHLYAVDDVDGSFGIRNYNVTLSGVTAINNRGPFGSYIDENTDLQNVGFNDLRSGTNINPVVAGQALGNATQIGGFGQTASDLATKVINETGGPVQSASGQWGTYGDGVYTGGFFLGVYSSGFIISSGRARSALLLAEGTYSSGTPSVTASSISRWTNAGLTTSSIAGFTTILNVNAFIGPEPTTAVLVAFAAFACGCLRRRRS